MATEDELEILIQVWKAEKATLENLKTSKAVLKDQLQRINDQIALQEPVVLAAKQAMKDKASVV